MPFLTNELSALLLQHPKSKLRDTAQYRPFQRFANNKWRPRKLRDLVKENLKGKEGFQVDEHDSVQDAKATIELFFKLCSQHGRKNLLVRLNEALLINTRQHSRFPIYYATAVPSNLSQWSLYARLDHIPFHHRIGHFPSS